MITKNETPLSVSAALAGAATTVPTAPHDPGTTHFEGCHTDGPKHWRCALEKLAASERTCAELRAERDECAQIIGDAICELAGIPREDIGIDSLPDMCRDYVEGSQAADWQLEAACEHWKRRATELARLEGEGGK